LHNVIPKSELPPPNIANNNKKASVKIVLEADEFDQLQANLLNGNNYFPKEVAQQSMLMENLNLYDTEKRGLSMLPLKAVRVDTWGQKN